MKIRLPLQLLVSAALVIMVLVVGGTIGSVAYVMSLKSIEKRAQETVQRVTTDVQENLWYLVNPALDAVRIVSLSSLGDAASLPARLQRLHLAVEILKDAPIISSIQIGYDTGEFLSVRNLGKRDHAARWPELARYEVESIERSAQPPRERLLYYDANLHLLSETEKPVGAQTYDPREREWYAKALRPAERTLVATTPYILYGNDLIGTTASMRTISGRAVISADVTLADVSKHLWKERVTANSILALVNAEGSIVASDTGPDTNAVAPPVRSGRKLTMPRLANSGIPLLAALDRQLGDLNTRERFSSRITVDGVAWRVNVVSFPLPNLPPARLISAVPEHELLAEPYRQLTIYAWITIGFILIIIPIALVFAHRLSSSLKALNKDAESILNFDFSADRQIESTIREVDRVAHTMHAMKQTISRFLDVSRVVSSEENFDRLLDTLLKETISAAEASSGILYLCDDESFVPTAALCNGKDALAGLPEISLDRAGTCIDAALAAGRPIAVLLDETASVPFGLSPEMAAWPHGVIAPLVNRQGKLLGLIVLLRASPYSEAQLSFLRALTDNAAVSLETRELIRSQKALFEAFIQLIAGAIDAKSPYTGAHCRRVPELTKMLVHAACSETKGPYAEFQLSELEWEAVHLAAWLHDCGKIVTPVHVVDKATKLETIYNRIHEIRTRFEVLRRDATIACLQSMAAGESAETAQARLETEHKALEDDFAFVAACNVGGEFMSPDKIARLEQIASRSWLRTFDDRLGLSHDEAERKMACAQNPLPATENLLGNKAEQKFVRRESEITPQSNPWAFNMNEPELLYDCGELYNLCVSRGTLTEEERYIINQHITQTIMMLSALPFPKHLRSVADIAGGHHEKMDGTGYPRGLTKAELTPVSRMMAIADIFEALTAIDRPYKRGKSLSEALGIMRLMKRDHHIDPELFDLFLRSGVYMTYARQFMRPEQIDAVDIAAFVG